MAGFQLDDELVEQYLAECREHLDGIENDLLAIERAGADIDEELVNRVFRAAHSIKGGAGFFDLAKIRELAHKTENALDMVRSRRLVPSPEAVNILLLAFDKLRDLINDPGASDEADIAEFVVSLTGLTSSQLPAEDKPSVTERVRIETPRGESLIEATLFDLKQARVGGKSIYLIEFDLIHDIQQQGKTPLDELNHLMRSGNVLEAVVDIVSAGTLDEEPSNRLGFQVLYATPLGPELIGELVPVPSEQIHLVEPSGSVRTCPAEDSPASETPAAAAPSEPAEEPTPSVTESAGARRDTVHHPAGTPGRADDRHAPTAAAETTLRLNVALLDSLMNLVGELVLSRNQMNEAISQADMRVIRTGGQRLSQITSELQEAVMRTRMQPIRILFNKFPRLVRDLARDLDKETHIELNGGDVEMDKTILEGLSDPLTHMVRNAVDHGVEAPAARVAAGKPPAGTVTLTASHQAGQVVIEVADDGGGIDAERVAASALAKGLVREEEIEVMSARDKIGLIFHPGLSTAGEVTDVSGRGVGMDVVKTNLDKLGGDVAIESAPGSGTVFRIKLPLTLAIIPSLLASVGGERYAIPQVNISEVIRIPMARVSERVKVLGGAEVLVLRERLLPLLRLAEALGVPGDEALEALHVVVVDTGAFTYGLVVEGLHESVDIVVKPLGQRFEGLREYAGATILGDGCVALILDVVGLADKFGVAGAAASLRVTEAKRHSQAVGENRVPYLVFHNGAAEPCAAPLDRITRVETLRRREIEGVAGKSTIHRGGRNLPLIRLSDVVPVGELPEQEELVVIVFETAGREAGLLAARPVDVAEQTANLDLVTHRQRGVIGSVFLKDRTTLVVDLDELGAAVFTADEAGLPIVNLDDLGAPPAGVAEDGPAEAEPAAAAAPMVLLAEDSDFFRSQVRNIIEAGGYRVIAAEDGQAAWELLDRHAEEVDLVTTDIEMPRLDGLGLARRIRADRRFASLPVIALSSLAGEDDHAKALEAGVDEYQIKLDREELLESVGRMLAGSAPAEEREPQLAGEPGP